MNNLPHDARRILAFPKRGNIYTERLYDAVEARGVIVIEGEWSSRWLRRHVRPNDLIHIHWPSFLYFDSRSRVRTGIRLARLWVLMKWAKRHGATIVWTAHNLYPHEGNQSLLEHRLGRKITVALADYVVVHGPSAAALVTKEFGIPPARLRIGYHPNWIGYYPNTSTYDQCRAKLNVRPDEYLYVHLGRCKPYKGLETLIDAFRTTASGARLLIAGKFSSPAYLEKVTALARASAGVEIVPESIRDDAMQVYLNAADCVVLPYRAVLTSGTALLALSFGRPVIGPNLGSMRDHIGMQCGILYPADEPGALSRALHDIRERRFDAATIMQHAAQFKWSDLADLLCNIQVPVKS